MLTAGVTNLGLALGDFRMDGNLVALQVRESRQDNTDLNGDGDTNDEVMHVFDARTGTTTNLGLNGFFPEFSFEFHVDGNLIAFAVFESEEGSTDLNGDLDTNDLVMHVFDANTGITTNLGLDITSNFGFDFIEYQLDGNLLAFVVSESGQGNTDLNGDGDTNDEVLHIFDASTGTTANLGLDSTNDGLPTRPGGLVFQLDRSLLAVQVSERQQGNTDLNGDGDTNDKVLHIFDASTGTTTNLGRGSSFFQLDGNLLAFSVGEFGDGNADLNGDLDTNDLVMHVFDANTGITTNLGLDGHNLQLDENLLAFSVSESRQGVTDLNGNGDAGDFVVHVFDASKGTTTNLGLDGRNLQLVGNLLAFVVGESQQGFTDLNGDGDTLDEVMHVFDASTGVTTNLGLVSSLVVDRLQLVGNLLAFAVSEDRQGNTDLNGDGDALDPVMHVFDASTGTTTNLELASFVGQVDGNFIQFGVSEARQGNTDLNGDGDAGEFVVHVFDASTGIVTNLRLQDNGSQMDGNVLVTSVREASQDNKDLNGDGDTLDPVIHVIDLSLRLDPVAGITQLIADVEALNLQQGIENSLDAKLEAAENALDDVNENNNVAAINSLQAFINGVEAQSGNKINTDDAAGLIVKAECIIELLEAGLYPTI